MYVERDLNKALSPYIVEAALPMVVSRLESRRLRLDLSPRKGNTLGYYAHRGDKGEAERKKWGEWQTISLQIELNPYALLLVFIHEWAHLMVHLEYPKASPHGKEWRKMYIKEAMPFLREDIFPHNLWMALNAYFDKPRALWDLRLQEACAPYGSTRAEFVKIYHRFLERGLILPAPSNISKTKNPKPPLREPLGLKSSAHSIKGIPPTASSVELQPLWGNEAENNRELLEDKPKMVWEEVGVFSVGQLPLPSYIRISGLNEEVVQIEEKVNTYIIGKEMLSGKSIRVHVLTWVILLKKIA